MRPRLSEERELTIREMGRDDCAAVAELTGELGYPAAVGDIVRRFDLIARRDDAQIFVAQRGAHIDGWIHVHATYLLEADTRAEIGGLVVAATARRSGVGRRLVSAAEDWALARGIDMMAVRSNVVRVEAHAFYERLGYHVVKSQKAFRKSLVSAARQRLD